MINSLSADQQAATINYAVKFEQEYGYDSEQFENFRWKLNQFPAVKQKLMKFCRETSDLTRKLYFAVLFTDEIDNTTFYFEEKQENPIIEFIQWVAAFSIVFGGAALVYGAFCLVCIALS